MDLRELPARAFDRHPWEIARADFFLRLLREHLPRAGKFRALDVGAGDGYLAGRLVAELPAVRHVTCLDPAYGPEWLRDPSRAQPGIELAQTWPDGSYDLILLLDVLEHAADDQGLLAQAMARATAGSSVLVSAPAHPLLFSGHDARLGHQRRYSSATLRALAGAAGLEIVAHGQLFTSLLVPRALAKLGEVARGGAAASAPTSGPIETSLGSWHHGNVLTCIATRLLALDGAGSRFAARWGVPLPGLSTWVLARRP